MNSYRVALLTLAILAAAHSANACETYVKHEPNDFKQLQNDFMNTDTQARLARLMAFGELACSKDVGVRQALIEMALSSGDDALRASALEKKMMAKDAIVVAHSGDADRLTEAAKKYIIANPVKSFPVFFKDYDKRCLSINGHSDDECNPRIQVTIDGLNVVISNDSYYEGQFRLDSENILRGKIVLNRGAFSIDGEISLD